jgi:hypothetical protein
MPIAGKEDDMSLHLQPPQDQLPQAASNELHPTVHRAAAALLIWFVAAAWLLFGGTGYIDLALAMISVLVFMIIAIPVALWRAGARARGWTAGSTVSHEGDPSHAIAETESWSRWLRGEFSTCTDQERGSESAVEILLPIAAVALGITVLGVVFELIRVGVV